VAVFLQNKPTPDKPTWNRIMLASEQPQDNDYGIVFSQPHSAYLADIDSDGVKDIVTGKRYWAHNGHDPDEHGHRVIYWYQTKRDGKGGVDFIPHLVDAESGVGVDVQVGDVNGDLLPDIVVGNKAGVFILTQERQKSVTELTPKKLYGPALKPQTDYAKGQSPADALKTMQLPGGFKAELIAAEPNLVQPIAFTFDERGRIWVVEGNTYPKPREVGKGQDRIKILEDKDGDGSFETIKIFCEGLNLVSGIELGFGGVWVGAAPYLMFIPDKDRNDQPDPSDQSDQRSKVPGLIFTAYALLDGWGSQDTHETLNSFIWGPDGWLYGCHGVFTHSKVGKPGTPEDKRIPINAGVWRYHPLRHEFEIFAEGTSNPWGLDYDQHGEWFVTACVIPHLYHIVPGGRYQRQAGQHFNPHTYEDIKTIADHAHYAGNPRPDVSFDKTTGAGVMNNDTNALGGGHAHCGLAIYQSSLFPPTYRNQLLFGNLHGHRLVANYTDPKGSSYVGKHAADFLRSNDMHFIPVTQKVGPDGALYVTDWSDQQICHRGSNAVENWDRSNGRIYRISYDGWKPWKGDFTKESDASLVKLAVQTENEWESRMARRMLMEKCKGRSIIAKGDFSWIHDQLQKWSDEVQHNGDIARELKIIWLSSTLDDPPRHFGEFYDYYQSDLGRASGIRYGTEFWLKMYDIEKIGCKNFAEHVSKETSPIVRREVASILPKWPEKYRASLATALLAHSKDAEDPIIPLLIWYGIEPLVAADPAVGIQLAKVSKIPKVTGFIYRRLSSDEAGRANLLKLAAETGDAELRENLLQALVQAARAGHQISQPADWPTLRHKVVSALAESGTSVNATQVTATLRELEAHMGIENALHSYRTRLSSDGPVIEREQALAILLQANDAATARVLQEILNQKAPASLRRKAIQALASLKNTETPSILSAALPKLTTSELPDAINTLASTKEGAKALLKAVQAKTIPATSLSPFLIRQLSAFDDPEISALIKSAWGDVNVPKADLAQRTKKYRDLLTPAALAKGNAVTGKSIFMATCGACHKLFGEGQNVGPDITGSNRADLNYLLENVLDPNAVIGKAYQLNVFTMKDGRVMSGVIKDENTAAVKIAMMGGVEFTLPMADIGKREVSKLSTMPEGLFDALPPEMVVDLVTYLQSSSARVSTEPDGPRAERRTAPGTLEAEALKIMGITSGKTRKQGMGGFGNQWSGGAQLWWTGGKPGDKLTLALPIQDAGKYTLHAVLTMAHDYGVVSITLDGKPITSTFDGYNAGKVILTDEQDWGTHHLTTGDHALTFTLESPNPAASPGNMVGLDYVRLLKP
jgi:putative membrane-bound dehydrogenase-like protein